MSNSLVNLQINNFRCLANVPITTNPLNVLFGPNGSGKSTFLDTIWFVRDCAIRGVSLAASDRDHGIGLLWDGAEDGETISITIQTHSATYQITFGYSSGRIEPFVGEQLYTTDDNICLIDRKIGSDKASFYQVGRGQSQYISLKDPEKLALTGYVDWEDML